MAKGEWKVQNDDDSSGEDHASNDNSDNDDEIKSPSYDDLVKLLNQYTKIIRKIRAKNKKLELEKDPLLAKYDIAKKLVLSLEKKTKLCHPNLRSLKLLKRSLEKTW